MRSRQAYLVAYNLCMLLGYVMLLPELLRSVGRGRAAAGANPIESVGSVYRLLIALSWLEVLHPLVGLVRGSALFPAVQIGFKSLVYFAFVEQSPTVQANLSVRALLLIWTAGELVRYPFYVAGLLRWNLRWLVWLRYSVWMLLYPAGIAAECLVLYQNLDSLDAGGRMSYPLPNSLNCSFHAASFVRFHLYAGVWLGSYAMLSHMYRQRTKVLASY